MNTIFQKAHPSSFALLLYKIADSKYAYLHEEEFKIINIPKQLLNNNIYDYQPENEREREWSSVIHALHQHALFSHSELYLYERENSHTLKIISEKIPNKGILLYGCYELGN